MTLANLGVGLQGLQLQLGTMCEMVGLQGLQLQVASMSANVGEGLQEQLLLLGQVLGRALDLTKVQAYTSLLQITISVFATMNCRTRQRRWLPYRPAFRVEGSMVPTRDHTFIFIFTTTKPKITLTQLYIYKE